MAESSLIMKFLIESGYYDDKTMLNRCIEIKRILIIVSLHNHCGSDILQLQQRPRWYGCSGHK